MDSAELSERLDAVQIVDVRERDEWDAGRIDGATHIPVDELDDRMGELDRDRAVVTVCRSGSRSAGAARRLVAAGFDAESLDGGLLAWAGAGLPLVDAGGGPGAVVDSDDAEQSFQSDLMSLGAEIDAHFGGREASEEEIEEYLHERDMPRGDQQANAGGSDAR